MSLHSPAFVAAMFVLLVNACGGPSVTVTSPSGLQDSTPWSDEFDGPAGTLPDPSRWSYDLGNNGGGGKGEMQSYTPQKKNKHLDGDGQLVIPAAAAAPRYTTAQLEAQGPT